MREALVLSGLDRWPEHTSSSDLGGSVSQKDQCARMSSWSLPEVVPELVELEVAVPHLKPASR
jgi:hypothetical protein